MIDEYIEAISEWISEEQRQRYNRLAEVIRRDLGEEIQKELIWKSKTLALAEIIQKPFYRIRAQQRVFRQGVQAH